MGTNEFGKVVHKGRIKVLTNFFQDGESSKWKENKRKHERRKRGGMNIGPKLADSQGKAKS